MFGICEPPPNRFETASLSYRVKQSPVRVLAQFLYSIFLILRGTRQSEHPVGHRVRVLCISDTHCCKLAELPPADVLIHCGDLTNNGTAADIQEQLDWILDLDYKYKIVIAGNHDSYFDPKSRKPADEARSLNYHGPRQSIHYLQHSSLHMSFPERDGRILNIYGAPQIPKCGGSEFAFQYARGQDAWTGTVPLDTDILVTHTPPKYHLDMSPNLGCEWLLRDAWRVKPLLHCFGHVHLGHGRSEAAWDSTQVVYEKLSGRYEGGFVRDLFAISAWLDLIRLVLYAVKSVLWSRVWGGVDKRTIMVNAAVMQGSTGAIGHAPILVEL